MKTETKIFKPFVSEDPNFEYIQGYQKCMQDVLWYLQLQDGRYIDSVKILDGIAEASEVLKKQLQIMQVNLKNKLI